MKFFLDTADLAEIEEAASWGALAGVTTNPSLYAKIGGKLDDFHNHMKRICDIVMLPVDPPASITLGIALHSKADLSPAVRMFLKYAVRMLTRQKKT